MYIQILIVNYPTQRSNPPKKSFSTQKLTLNGFKTIETTITEKMKNKMIIN